MQNRPTYSELLRHPNWQRKRLGILTRSDFTCEDCGAGDKTLHVHHTYYEKGLMPWEYPDESLHALCEECHKKAQGTKDALQRAIGGVPLTEHDRLIGYALALAAASEPYSIIQVYSYEVAEGIADALRIAPERVIAAAIDGMVDADTLFGLRTTHYGEE